MAMGCKHHSCCSIMKPTSELWYCFILLFSWKPRLLSVCHGLAQCISSTSMQMTAGSSASKSSTLRTAVVVANSSSDPGSKLGTLRGQTLPWSEWLMPEQCPFTSRDSQHDRCMLYVLWQGNVYQLCEGIWADRGLQFHSKCDRAM